MKRIFLAVTLFAAAASPVLADGTNILADEQSRVSYAVGLSIARNWQMQGVGFDADIVARAIKDVQSGGATLLTPEEASAAITQFGQAMAVKMAAKNKMDGETFLDANKKNPGVITLLDGLQYKVITEGTGPKPTAADTVTVNYRGTYINGTEFDSSYKRGQPAQFEVGRVIRGWSEAIQLMKTGSKWQLFIPAELAYGENPPRGIQPNATLIFEVELLSTQSPVPTPAPAAPRPPLTSDVIKVPSADELKNGAQVEHITPEELQKLQSQTNGN